MRLKLFTLLLLAGPMWGAATTVTEALYSPIDGARFSGKIRIDAPVITYSGVTYRNWSQTYTITSSTTFSVALQPNSSSTPYKFTYTPDRGSSWTEYCVVPASGTPVTLTSLGCTTTGAWTNVTVATTQLSGYIQAANFPALTGDVTNTAGSLATTVGKIQGYAVSSTAPTNGQALLWNQSSTRYEPGTVATSSAWGSITGTLSNQTDLQAALDLKAPLASPAFTGNPTAPTQSQGNNSTRLATTAYVDAGLSAITKKISATFLLCAGPCVANETSNWKWTAPFDVTFTGCIVDAQTYPTGSAITVDVLKTGATTIFSSTVPTLSAGSSSYNEQTGMAAAAALTKGQYVVGKVLTVGSSVAGQFVNVTCTATY